ncbi:MAG: MoaD/ThiS family protein [Methylococcales bacterium]|nr:MAG: MoaD/ThiS family protein [Methylococcales bacterium]
MSIKVHYFASLKESIGRSKDELIFTEPLTVYDVWQQANPDKDRPNQILAAVNMDYADWDNPVSDGDVVAFFPPVTGG